MQTLAKFVRASSQAGIDEAQLLELLEGGLTVSAIFDLIEQRLKQAERDYEEHYGKTTR